MFLQGKDASCKIPIKLQRLFAQPNFSPLHSSRVRQHQTILGLDLRERLVWQWPNARCACGWTACQQGAKAEITKNSHLPVRREHVRQHDAKWPSPFRVLLKLEKRAWKIGNSTAFILPWEKMRKKKNLNCFSWRNRTATWLRWSTEEGSEGCGTVLSSGKGGLNCQRNLWPGLLASCLWCLFLAFQEHYGIHEVKIALEPRSAKADAACSTAKLRNSLWTASRCWV